MVRRNRPTELTSAPPAAIRAPGRRRAHVAFSGRADSQHVNGLLGFFRHLVVIAEVEQPDRSTASAGDG
jgi:hypothetical protein